MITARNNLKRYGSPGVLFTPTGNGVFDPNTGDTAVTYNETDIMYITSPLESDDQDFGLNHFSKAAIWFMPKDVDYSPMPGIGSDSFIKDQHNSYDIQAINKHTKNGEIIVYEALVRA